MENCKKPETIKLTCIRCKKSNEVIKSQWHRTFMYVFGKNIAHIKCHMEWANDLDIEDD